MCYWFLICFIFSWVLLLFLALRVELSLLNNHGNCSFHTSPYMHKINLNYDTVNFIYATSDGQILSRILVWNLKSLNLNI